jgi:hypothetical protein
MSGQKKTMEAILDIPFELDVAALCRKVRIEPDSDDAAELEALVNEVREVGRPKALYKESFIEAKGEQTVTIDDVTFTSRALRRNMDGVQRVFPYVATCGSEVDEIPIPQGDFLKGFWLDVMKADLLASSVRRLNELIQRKHRLGKTSVMSPGSGDAAVWPIQQQKDLFSLLNGVEEFIGVRLTDSFLMLPNKSVSGIRFPTEIDFQSCQLCHRESCPGRRAPFDRKLWESVQHD